jgi:hypothetical protein
VWLLREVGFQPEITHDQYERDKYLSHADRVTQEMVRAQRSQALHLAPVNVAKTRANRRAWNGLIED